MTKCFMKAPLSIGTARMGEFHKRQSIKAIQICAAESTDALSYEGTTAQDYSKDNVSYWLHKAILLESRGPKRQLQTSKVI